VAKLISQQTGRKSSSDTLAPRFLLLLGCYFSLHVLLRVVISGSLDYDEAEQVLLGQWLLAGYTEQPPLYSWIQHVLFGLLGKGVLAVSLLKNSLLFLTYLFVFLSGRLLLKDTRAAVLAASSLLLIPQIAWESQRDMTHTTLVVFAASASLYQLLRTVEKRTLLNYMLLGLFTSIGFLAKANFVIFAVVALLTLASCSEGRRMLFHRYMLLTLLMMIALTGNYFWWMYHNQDIVFSASDKFNRATGDFYIDGLVSLFSNGFLFLTPLWLVYLLIFWEGYAPQKRLSASFGEKFIARYMLLVFVLLLLIVLLFKVSYVKDRWLQPLLFAVPLFFFSRIAPEKITTRRFTAFSVIIFIAAMGVYTAFTIRVVGVSWTNSYTRMSYPFSAIAKDIRSTGFERGLIISDNRFLAGNMLLQFPDSSAIIPDYHFEDLAADEDHRKALVVWRAEIFKNLPEDLAKFIYSTYNIEARSIPANYLEHKYKFARNEAVTLGYIEIDLGN
jgi:4-amino-4-deoxy-L-arabinose transferase-like glycosyltransferase